MSWLAFAQAVAFTLLFVNGTIFAWLRKERPSTCSARGFCPFCWANKRFRELVSCALCSGFWVGFAAHADNYWKLPAFALTIASFVGWGSLVGATAWLLHRTAELGDSARFWLDKRAGKPEDE
jgi:hypothetical protein